QHTAHQRIPRHQHVRPTRATSSQQHVGQPTANSVANSMEPQSPAHATSSHQHVQPTTTTTHGTPFIPPHAGEGGCLGYCACCARRPAHAGGAGPRPSPPPPVSMPPHATPRCSTTPTHHPPPHGRSGQDITGVAVEEEGGGFPVCVSTALELFQRWTRVAQVTVGQVCRSPLE